MGAPKQAQRLCPHAAPRLPTAAATFPFPPDASNATVHAVRGPLRYYHYGLDGVRNHGWGCGYRTVQTMLSWLQPDEPPPDISTIQRLLKHAQPNAYPGETGWIGVADAVIILDVLHRAPMRVRRLASGREAAALLPELAAHFDAGDAHAISQLLLLNVTFFCV